MEISNSIKLAAGAVGLVVAISSGLWALDTRYAKDQEVAKSLSQFDSKVQQDIDKFTIQILNIRQDQLTKEYYAYKQLRRQYPDDSEIKLDLENLNQQRLEIDKELKGILVR